MNELERSLRSDNCTTLGQPDAKPIRACIISDDQPRPQLVSSVYTQVLREVAGGKDVGEGIEEGSKVSVKYTEKAGRRLR
jgi:hypothetical protein